MGNQAPREDRTRLSPLKHPLQHHNTQYIPQHGVGIGLTQPPHQPQQQPQQQTQKPGTAGTITN